ncbi:MAG: metal-dependent phosphohydrolase [Leptolyngbyaceae cyanobacterium]
MFGTLEIARIHLLNTLKTGYVQLFGTEKSHCLSFLLSAADHIIQRLAASTALYHNADHTILVTLVGQEILIGKQELEGSVSPEDWLYYLLALLCHDIGFIRGVCERDDMQHHDYHTGQQRSMVRLTQGATDASLTPYHVDRGQQFVAEFIYRTGGPVLPGQEMGDFTIIDVARIQAYIERTRFPVPKGFVYQQTQDYPGLTRAADLIGQLSDPLYLQKTTALFYEFEETGANEKLGYHSPDDVWRGYPKFFRNVVFPYLDGGIKYLDATESGRQILTQLYENVAIAEQWAEERHLLVNTVSTPVPEPNTLVPCLKKQVDRSKRPLKPLTNACATA